MTEIQALKADNDVMRQQLEAIKEIIGGHSQPSATVDDTELKRLLSLRYPTRQNMRDIISMQQSLLHSRPPVKVDVDRIELEQAYQDAMQTAMKHGQEVLKLQEALRSMYSREDMFFAFMKRFPNSLLAEGLVKSFADRKEFEDWLTQFDQRKRGG